MKQIAQKRLLMAPVEKLIRTMRDQRVILDHDLAGLYGVEAKILNRSVRRNLERFPEDFMFQLTQSETESLRSQIVTLEKGRGKYSKYQPLAFTEHGIAMLSSVLRSPRAVQMNILIIRAFVRMRELIATHKEFAVRVEKLEKGHEQTGAVIEVLIQDIEKIGKDIHWIKNPPLPKNHRMGFYVEKGGKK